MSYYYRQTADAYGKKYFSVGFYRPNAGSGPIEWQEESKYNDANLAAWRVHFLNGGCQHGGEVKE